VPKKKQELSDAEIIEYEVKIWPTTDFQKHRGIKWFVCAKIKMVKSSPYFEDQTSEPHFRSLCMTAVNETEI
jgi:hypothetical protein